MCKHTHCTDTDCEWSVFSSLCAPSSFQTVTVVVATREMSLQGSRQDALSVSSRVVSMNHHTQNKVPREASPTVSPSNCCR